MTLKEELEILRGEPIEVFTGDPMKIPCIETSDPDKLCKHPVVSVHMITYNHEPYIRQAIEGVMMQKADFEFELVIGEDCSTDKTREICFEYQKKYPDKIRVLWWHKNLYRNLHSAGGNGRRVTAHCRGEFIAYCEGDDWWVDPLKLQKQVDVMRKHPNVGLCFTNARIFYLDGTVSKKMWGSDYIHMPEGVIPGRWFCLQAILGKDPYVCGREWSGTSTQTVLVRKSVVDRALQLYDLMCWRLNLGDLQGRISAASLSDVYFLKDDCARYRVTTSGALGSLRQRVHCDGVLVRLYFFNRLFDLPLALYPPAACDDLITEFVKSFCDKENFPLRARYFGRFAFIMTCLRNPELCKIWLRPATMLWSGFCLLNWISRYPQGFMRRVMPFMRKLFHLKPDMRILELYEETPSPQGMV